MPGRGGDRQDPGDAPRRDALVDALAGAQVGLSQSAVHRIWKAFGLQPHRQDTWKLSKDPLFIEKVRDVVGLYLNPPERAVVLCVDEKSQIQALDRTAPILPMLPGTPERATHDYKRSGTSTSTPRWTSPAARSSARCTPPPRDRVQEVPPHLDHAVPAGLDVHLVLDNSSTHKTPAIQRWLADTPPVRPALHPDQLLLAEPRRTLVRRTHQQEAPPQRPPIRPRTQQPTSATGSRPGTRTPDPTSGPRPPTRSSNRSPPTANESMTQDTSSPAAARFARRKRAGGCPPHYSTAKPPDRGTTLPNHRRRSCATSRMALFENPFRIAWMAVQADASYTSRAIASDIQEPSHRTIPSGDVSIVRRRDAALSHRDDTDHERTQLAHDSRVANPITPSEQR